GAKRGGGLRLFKHGETTDVTDEHGCFGMGEGFFAPIPVFPVVKVFLCADAPLRLSALLSTASYPCSSVTSVVSLSFLCAFPRSILFGVVDLGALEFAAVVDVEGFPFGKDVEDVAAFAVTVAGGFHAAEGQMN